MSPQDFERFRDLMRGMGRVFNSEPDNLVLDVYWLALRDWTLEDFQEAAAHLMATAQFMPRPADFTKLRKASKPTPHEAWSTAMANCTSWRDGVSYAGPLIDRVVNTIGGYRSLAMADIDADLPHIQRRFLEAYEQISEVEEVRDALPNIALPTLPRSGASGFTSIGSSPVLAPKTKPAARLPHKEPSC